MRRLLTSISIASLWLAATLFGAPSDGQFVLCYGTDGHIALEPAHEASCGSESPAAQAVDASLPDFGTITDADCTDVPANHHAAHQTVKRPTGRSGGKRQSAPPWCDALRLASPANVVCAALGDSSAQASPTPSHLALLQSVVLRL
jgi:hypothetical protein